MVPPHRGRVCSGGYQITKAQIFQRSCQPAQASSFRTFWILWMSATTLPSRSIFEKHFAWTIRKEQKVAPLPAQTVIRFKTLAMACVISQLLCPSGSQVRSALCLVGKLTCCQTTFGSVANLTHAAATAMHFPSNTGLKLRQKSFIR